MSTWTHLSSLDKQAFFSILDEYFESRPHLFQTSSSSAQPASQPIQSSLKSLSSLLPQSSTSNTSKAAHSNGLPSAQTIGLVSGLVSHSQPPSSQNNGPSAQKPLASRIQSISQHFTHQHPSSGSPPNPPESRIPAGLVSSQKFFGGLVSQAEKDALNARPRGVLADAAAASSVPSQQTQPSSQKILPPPIRRSKPVVQQEPEEEAELVEAMYDYDGTSAEDLSFKEHQVIKVTEHISEDWWNGQIDNGPIGMFPSSYVKRI